MRNKLIFGKKKERNVGGTLCTLLNNPRAFSNPTQVIVQVSKSPRVPKFSSLSVNRDFLLRFSAPRPRFQSWPSMGKGKRNTTILISSSDDDDVKDKNSSSKTDVSFSKSAPTKRNPKRVKRASVSRRNSSPFQSSGVTDFDEVHFASSLPA